MKVCLWNDQMMPKDEVRIDPEDRGYQFGDGVYEVIRVYRGKTFAEKAHMDRLKRSLQELRIPFSYSEEDLSKRFQELIEAERVTDGIIYLQVTRGTAPRSHAFPEKATANLVAYASSYPRPVEMIEQGGEAVLFEDIRWLRCDIKSLNLLGAVLAKQSAKERGAVEAIQHRDQVVTEGSASNVFIIKEGTLYTHPSNHLILNGITRQIVIKLAEELGIPLQEVPFRVDDLLTADEAFITGTTTEVTPIIRVEGKEIGSGKPGEITRKLQAAFEREIGL